MINKSRQCGFTLVEIMIVVAILILIGAIATPILLNFLPNMRLRSAARDVYSAMMEAKTEAIQRGVNVTVLFNSPGNSYIVFIDDGAGGGVAGNGIIDNLAEQTITTVPTLPDRVTFDPTVGGDGVTFAINALVFSSQGIPVIAGAGGGLGGGIVGLRATDSLGNTTRQRTITVATAGQISMQ